MTCPDCGREEMTIPCVCGYGATLPEKAKVYPIPYKPFINSPDGITKEEFGLNLYEVIKTIGGIMGLEQQRAAAIHYGKGHEIQNLLKRRTQLQKTLAVQLPTLNNDEMAQVLQKYPWVVTA
jgi:hypothetical protein